MKKLMTIALSALCAAVAFTSLAEPITWTGEAGDGLWVTAGNWDLGRVPNAATDDIVIGPFDEPTEVNNTMPLTYGGSVTLKRNAILNVYHNRKTTKFDAGSRLIIEDGAKFDTWHPDAGGVFVYDNGASVQIYGSGVMTNRSIYGTGSYNTPNRECRLRGGVMFYMASYLFDSFAIEGTDVYVPSYKIVPVDATTGHVIDLSAGSIAFDHSSWESTRPWKASDYPDSYINFTPFSTGRLIFRGKARTAKDAWTYFFQGTYNRGRYDHRSLTFEEFDELFDVTTEGTSTIVALKPQATNEIVVIEHAENTIIHDAKPHLAVDLFVAYPHEGTTIEYKVGDSGEWSETVPDLVDFGSYAIHTRVTDTTGALETREKTYVVNIVGQPLAEGGEVAPIPDQEFTGEAIEPDVVVTFTKNAKTVTLVRDTDYKVAYTDNRAPGVATAIVSGIGNYSGELRQTFAINATLTDGDIYVDPAAEAGGDGSSWAKAVSTLAAVVDMLKEGDRTIYMKGGTQTFVQTIDVSGMANLTIKGGYLGDGFPGSRDPKALPSILDGQGTKRIMNAEGCANLTLDGITFANGLTPAGTSGGALRLSGSDSATVVGCTFKGNKSYSNAVGAANGGGAISSHNGGLSVTDCRFEDNLAFSQDDVYCYPWGGAAYLSGTGAKSFVNCVFLRNAAKAISGGNMAQGGAIATAASAVEATTVDNCLFVANRVINNVAPPESFNNVGLAGSAICGDNMTVRNCTIAGGSGAAIVPRGQSGKVSVSNCVLAENGLDLSIKAVDNQSTDYSFINKFTLDNIIVGRTQITNAFPANCTRDVDFAFEAGCRLPVGYANIGYAFPADEPAPMWTELYVDPAVAATGDGTAASPFKTLTEAVAAAGDWTKIHLEAGTYSASANGETFPISVANRLGLQILGAANRGSVIDGEGIEKADKLGALISLSESSLVRLSNLKLTGVNRVVRGGNPVGGALTAWASQLTVVDCEISGNRFRNWDTTSSAYGVGVTLVATSANFLGTDILDNLVYGSCPNTTFNGIGLMLYDSVGTFERGRIEGNGADAEATIKNAAHRGAGAFAYQSQVSFRSALIAGNAFTPCNGAALAAAMLNGRGTTVNVVLENCTVNDNVGDNVLYWTKESADTFSLVNTFVGNTDGQPAITLGGSYAPVVLNSAFVAANAFFTDGENGNILLKKGLAATFKDAADGDYRLAVGSELLKGGRSLEWFNSDSADLYGAKRVSGRRVDIGCASLIPGLMLIIW